MDIYKKYLVEERSEKDVEKHGSKQNAIKHLKSELNELESLWGKYSCDCLGHAITCTKLKIEWLENHFSALTISK